MRYISFGITLALVSLLPANTVTLLSGRQIQGAYLGHEVETPVRL
jgi:hypothetical protein